VAKLLAVKTLGEGGLGFVRLYLDANVPEAGEFEYFRGFCRPWQGDKKQGQGNWIRTVRGPTGGSHLFDAYDVKTEVHQPVRDILRRSVTGQMA
jgi:hypothetical protein